MAARFIDAVIAEGGRRSIGLVCRRAVARASVRVKGVEFLPPDGPVILVARHVHHLLDGCVLWQTLPRSFRVLAAADWAAEGAATGRLLGWACRTMGWPTVLRTDAPSGPSGYAGRRVLREATRQSLAILRAGEVLLVFPEAYPAVDPNPTPKDGLDAWLPFRPGFAQLARLAAGEEGQPVPVVPVGFAYDRRPDDRWRVVARLGPALALGDDESTDDFVARVEARVRALSSG